MSFTSMSTDNVTTKGALHLNVKQPNNAPCARNQGFSQPPPHVFWSTAQAQCRKPSHPPLEMDGAHGSAHGTLYRVTGYYSIHRFLSLLLSNMLKGWWVEEEEESCSSFGLFLPRSCSHYLPCHHFSKSPLDSTFEIALAIQDVGWTFFGQLGFPRFSRSQS